MGSTDVVLDTLEMLGLNELHATAAAEAPEVEAPAIQLVTGTWTPDELDRLEAVATRLQGNPATAVAAEGLKQQIATARANIG